MWRDHLFRQRNKTKERAVGLGVGGPLPTKADFIVPRPKGPPGLMTTCKTNSTTAVDPWHLKVKEQDISLTKYYCITINIQKISSIH